MTEVGAAAFTFESGWLVSAQAAFNSLRGQTDPAVVPPEPNLPTCSSTNLQLHSKSLYGRAVLHPPALVRSSAVLTWGGIRPAAATLRSLTRKLKVAHAFGCKYKRYR